MESGIRDYFMPQWLERLIAREGKAAYSSSKHARGRRKPRHWRKKKRAARKRARKSRRRNRFG